MTRIYTPVKRLKLPKMPKLRPCFVPWCKHDDPRAHPDWMHNKPLEIPMWWIECHKCKVRTPLHLDRNELAQMWNDVVR